MSKFFFGWRSLRDNVECFIQCHNYALPFIIQKQYSCSTILNVWSKHFYSYCIFNTFDKIRVFVRTINLFIHLASDLYMIHSALSRTSPNSTPVTDVHCTNPLIDNKRSRNDQKQIFKNTFKNRKLPTILMIWSFQRWNRTKFFGTPEGTRKQ